MTRNERVFLHSSVALTSATGAVFAWMKYAMTNDDPFAVANHPWQPYILDAHVVIAPFALVAFGLIFRSHAWRRYRGRKPERRFSGIGSMALFVPMALSGYLLQVMTNESARKAMAVTHWIASGLFVISYLVHQVTKKPAATHSAHATE